MFSSEGVMEDIPLLLIIIPVRRQRLQTDGSRGIWGRASLSHCSGVSALSRDCKRTDGGIGLAGVERDNMPRWVCFTASDNEL